MIWSSVGTDFADAAAAADDDDSVVAAAAFLVVVVAVAVAQVDSQGLLFVLDVAAVAVAVAQGKDLLVGDGGHDHGDRDRASADLSPVESPFLFHTVAS